MKKENEIDQLFKKGLEEPDIPFNELDWIKMADKLDASKARKDRSLWYAMAGIAAAILVVLSFFLFSVDNQTVSKKQPNYNAKTKPSATDMQPSFEEKRPAEPQIEKGTMAKGVDSGRDVETSVSWQSGSKDTQEVAAAKTPMLERSSAINLSIFSDENLRHPAIALSLSKTHITTTLSENATMKPEQSATDKARLDKKNGAVAKLSLSILAAPDVTDTRSSIGTKISSNFGLLLTYPISKKLSISSGAVYARKLYDYGGIAASAYGNKNTPWEVDADCYVIDVPLNLNYQVMQKKKFSVSVNTGLSSYFMLKEKYDYINVNAAGEEEYTSYVIKNENKHLLGVANFSISLNQKVNDRISIGVQPFFKVPLTGIGYYDTNLKSKGVAVSVSIKPFGNKK
jgi:hypothetical protein